MKVGVIMGGISSEREISLKSGNSIVEKIDKNKYEVMPIVIDNKEDIVNKVKDILLIFHGRRCCIARNPKCSECPFTNRCKYFKEQKSKIK